MSDPAKTSHGIDRTLISAYYDDALDDRTRRRVEEHLARCVECRERLAAYAALGGALRIGPIPSVPPTVDARIRDLAQRAARSPGRRGWVPGWLMLGAPGRVALAALLVAALLIGAVRVGLPIHPEMLEPAVASAYACTDPSECAVAIQFAGQVDQASVERTMRIDPPIPHALAWQGNRLLIRLTAPPQPAVTYTVNVQAAAALSIPLLSAAARPTPVAIHFVAPGPDAPIQLATAVALATPTRAPTTIAPVSTAQPTVPATVVPAACVVQPVRGFGTLYQAQPSIASHLGCARAPEAGMPLAVEPFQHGRLIWRSDRREIIALLDDGHWRSYPDTYDGTETVTPAPGEPIRGFGKLWRTTPELRATLGSATAPEQAITGAIQDFDHGTMIWTPDRSIVVLFAEGTWERTPDTFVDVTATATANTAPSPPATPTLAPSPTATPAPASSPAGPTTPVAPATGSGSGCPITPIRGFGLVYSSHPDVASRLGCASATEIGSSSLRQTFEHGVMIRRDDVRQIFVIRADGSWSVSPDTYQDGEALADVGPAPAGRQAPLQGFGKLWRQQPGLRQTLGWATAPAQEVAGAYEDFAAGHMVWTSDRLIYALFADGTSRSFPDQFVEPTSTPVARQ